VLDRLSGYLKVIEEKTNSLKTTIEGEDKNPDKVIPDMIEALIELSLQAQQVYLATHSTQDTLGGKGNRKRSDTEIQGGDNSGVVKIRRNSMQIDEDDDDDRMNQSVYSRHSAGAIVPMMKDMARFKAFKKSVVPDDIPRGKMGLALRHTKGHFVVLRPKIETIRLYDSWTVWDEIAKRPTLFAVTNLVYLVSLLSMVFSPLILLFVPPAMMRFTETTELIFGELGKNTTAVPDPSFEPPWGKMFDSFAVFMFLYVCATISILFLFNIFQWNLSMCRLIWMTSRVRVTLVVSLTFIYAVASMSLLPKASHLAWLITRTIVISAMIGSDARLVNHRLRFKKEVFRSRFGGGGARRGWVTVLSGLAGCLFVFADLLRHGLVLFASENKKLFGMDIYNPATGTYFVVTDRDIADSTYYTSLVLFTTILANQVVTYAGSETTMAQCKFDYSER